MRKIEEIGGVKDDSQVSGWDKWINDGANFSRRILSFRRFRLPHQTILDCVAWATTYIFCLTVWRLKVPGQGGSSVGFRQEFSHWFAEGRHCPQGPDCSADPRASFSEVDNEHLACRHESPIILILSAPNLIPQAGGGLLAWLLSGLLERTTFQASAVLGLSEWSSVSQADRN